MHSWTIDKSFLKKASFNISPKEIEDTLERADAVCVNTFYFTHPWDMERCSTPITFEDKIDWTHSYKGDDEWAFMLNRQRFMADLGQAYVVTEDESYVSHWKRIFYEWVEANKDKSIHTYTHRKIDIGIRLVNWLKGYACIHDSDSWTASDDHFLKEQVRIQADILYNSFSPFDFQSNWGFLEVNGLLQAACFLGGTISEQWYKTSLERLRKMTSLQIYKDGLQKEQSPMYHHEVLHSLMEIMIVMKKNNRDVTKFIEDTTSRMLTAYYQIMKPNGHQPMLGDSDDTDIRSTLAIGAVLLHRKDLRALAGNECPLDILWYFGQEGLKNFETMEQKLPLETSCNLPDSGITVFRNGWDKADNYLLFDYGSMGQVNKGHGHDDNLHIELMAGGREFLIDGGRYTYCETEERQYFKSSQRHNTVSVDGYSASEYISTWKWDKAAEPIDEKSHFTEAYQFSQAGHKGFWRLSKPVHVTRKIIYIPDHYYIVVDIFTSNGRHEYTQHFHFPEETPIEWKDKQLISDFKTPSNVVLIPFEEPDIISIKEGLTSRHYNEMAKSPYAEFTYKQKGDFAAPFIIIPFSNEKISPTITKLPVYHINGIKKEDSEVIAFECEINGNKDIIVSSLVGNDSFLVEGYQLCGELILIKESMKETEQIFVIQ